MDEIENFESGNFIHILDGEGNRIKCWKAIGSENEKKLNEVTK